MFELLKITAYALSWTFIIIQAVYTDALVKDKEEHYVQIITIK